MTLEQEIRKWLVKVGYPFELRVGRTLRDAGWEVEHGKLYQDPVTGKTREIDIYAKVSGGSSKPSAAITVALAVECKSSIDKPWLIFSTKHINPLAYDSSQRVSGTLAGYAILDASIHSDVPLALFENGPSIGHGMTRAFRDKGGGDPSGPYAAAQSAVTAATALDIRNEQFCEGIAPSISVIEIVIPITVVEGQLFKFHLSDDGRELLDEVSQMVVSIPHPVIPENVVYPLITTADVWPELAQDLAKGAHELANILIPLAPEIVGKYIANLESVNRRRGGAG